MLKYRLQGHGLTIRRIVPNNALAMVVVPAAIPHALETDEDFLRQERSRGRYSTKSLVRRTRDNLKRRSVHRSQNVSFHGLKDDINIVELMEVTLS
jgi:hypothetical protein